jgi:hypothetical protein
MGQDMMTNPWMINKVKHLVSVEETNKYCYEFK